MAEIRLYGTTSSGLPNLTYLWWASAGGTISSSDLTQNQIIISTAGTYHLQVWDAEGTPSLATSKVITSDLLRPDISVIHTPDTTELGGGTPSIELAGSSSAGDTFEWTLDGVFFSSSATIVATAIGVYVLTVTNSTNSCTNTYETEIVGPTAIPPESVIALYDDSGTVTGSHLDCFQDSQNITLNAETSTGSGPFTYLWSPGGEITPEITVTTSGTYGLIVTDINSTPSLETFVTITENLVSPTATISATIPVSPYSALPGLTLSFQYPTAFLDGSASTDQNGLVNTNITYLWSNGKTTPIIEVGAGGYTLAVTDINNGCANQDTITIIANPVTGISVGIDSVGTVLSCSATTITQTLSVTNPNSDPLTYQWSKTGVGDLVGQTSNTLEIATPGEYTVTAYNTVTTETITASVTITGNANDNLTSALITGSNLISCTGTTLLDGTSSTTDGPTSYIWTDAEQGGNLLGTSSTYLATSPDTYYLEVFTTGYPECSRSDKHTVTETIPPTVTIIASPSIVVPDGGTITLSADIVGGSWPYIYSWSTVNGTIVGGSPQTTPTITVSSGGLYSLTVTDNNGCPTTTSLGIIGQELDSQPPTAPTLLVSEQLPLWTTSVELNWWPSDDNVGVSHYEVYRRILGFTTWNLIDDTIFAPVVTYNDLTVMLDEWYEYQIIAFDGAGNESLPSNTSGIFVQSCLVEGTKLLDAEGDWRFIEDLVEGDELMASKFEDLADSNNLDMLMEWKSSELAEIRTCSKIATIYPFETHNTIIINKGLLESTPSHVQLINRDDEWKFSKMGDVQVGDKLYNIKREIIEVTDVEENTEKRTAYVLTLKSPTHMYFANEILTHNFKPL